MRPLRTCRLTKILNICFILAVKSHLGLILRQETIFSSEAQAKLFAAEDKHFWFRARAEFIIDKLKQFGLLDSSYKVAEIGCGNGYTSSQLIRHYAHYYAYEGSPKALEQMKCRLEDIDPSKYSLRVSDISQSQLEPNLDLVLALDVLEHIAPEDLPKVLEQIAKSLKSSGRLVLTVPAHMWLWSSVDEEAKHYQRFDIKSMRKLLEQNGFQIKYYSYLFLMVLPFYIAQRYLLQSREKISSSHLSINPILNLIFGLLSNLDLLASKLLGMLPLGSSLFCIACYTPQKNV